MQTGVGANLWHLGLLQPPAATFLFPQNSTFLRSGGPKALIRLIASHVDGPPAGEMARHRLPTELLERSGAFDHDPQRREARSDEPLPSGPLGDPPEYFSAAQKAIWHELAEQVPEGVLTIADRILVEITSG